MSEDAAFEAVDEEPLYTDEHGIPMLFDVVVPGDYVKAAGVLLEHGHRPAETVPGLDAEAMKARLERAIEAVMPQVTEEATRLIREALRSELESPPRADDGN